jgi:hypothetical protein
MSELKIAFHSTVKVVKITYRPMSRTENNIFMNNFKDSLNLFCLYSLMWPSRTFVSNGKTMLNSFQYSAVNPSESV